MKTTPQKADVESLLTKVAAGSRADCVALVEMMQKATGADPVLWGAGILGFGHKRLVYESGRELDWFQVGFAPRKSDLTLYGLDVKSASLKKLGPHKTGKGCLYLKRLADVDCAVLAALMKSAAKP